MSVLLLFRSLTHAQRGVRILQNNGLPAAVVKAPAGSSEHGCAYAARVQSKRLEAALTALRHSGLTVQRVIEVSPDGSFREVTV